MRSESDKRFPYASIALFLGGLAWVFSFFLPVFHTATDSIDGYWVFISGWMGLVVFQFAWLANLLIPAAVILMHRAPIWAALIASLALLTATQAFWFEFIPDSVHSIPVTGLGEGFWFWYASIVLMGIGVFFGADEVEPQDRQTYRVEDALETKADLPVESGLVPVQKKPETVPEPVWEEVLDRPAAVGESHVAADAVVAAVVPEHVAVDPVVEAVFPGQVQDTPPERPPVVVSAPDSVVTVEKDSVTVTEDALERAAVVMAVEPDAGDSLLPLPEEALAVDVDGVLDGDEKLQEPLMPVMAEEKAKPGNKADETAALVPGPGLVQDHHQLAEPRLAMADLERRLREADRQYLLRQEQARKKAGTEPASSADPDA
ncbi:MAG: hypothetical protein KDI44_04160 [Thiothrix sp.]|nr:hypothetical protein [Thiothrix sp.]HPQ94267.1 hypothetical protein [Thiolinea sp.]